MHISAGRGLGGLDEGESFASGVLVVEGMIRQMTQREI